jgi:hypothetical protein
MRYLKPTLTALVLALSLASAGVRAQEQVQTAPPVAQEPAATPETNPDAKPAQAQKRKPIKRRSVQQIIGPTPPIVTEGYRPSLTVPPPAAMPAPSAPAPGPVRMNSCDAGGCTDTSGARYNGAGSTVIGPQGQLCTKGVVNAQCF